MEQWTEIIVETSTAAVEAVAYQLTNHGAAGVKIDDAADFAQLTSHPDQYGAIIDPFSLPHRQSGAAVVFVCLGAPKQEKWIAQWGPATGAHLLVGMGGCLDVFSDRCAGNPAGN